MASQRVSVAVIGASHAGLGVSHRLLQQLPSLSITLINPSDQYYFNVAAPRLLVHPDSLPSSRYLYDISDAFGDYPTESFTFVKGIATRIDYSTKSIQVTRGQDLSQDDAGTIPFDYLVLASGTTTPATIGKGSLKLPFKATAFEDIRQAISNGQQKLRTASKIVIGGGGPLAIELAGELAEAATLRKVITLISKRPSLLESAPVTVQQTAEKLVQRRGVEVLKNTAVDRAERDSETKLWKVTLSTGQSIIADEYIAMTGVIPNNDFIPVNLLNEDGYVKVDKHLRVIDSEASRSDTYALGDITSHPHRLLSRIPAQAATVASNIVTSITKGGSLATYSADSHTSMLVVPIGQSTGTGHLGKWTLWGCIVWFFKGKDYLTYKAPNFLRGRA